MCSYMYTYRYVDICGIVFSGVVGVVLEGVFFGFWSPIFG